MEQTNKLRCAVIGIGHMGQFHVDKFSQMENVELIGVCDVDQQKTKSIANRFNTNAYFDHHDLLDKVDAVSIATPTQLHHPVGLDFLNNGVHVLLEKPMATSIEEAESLIQAATAHDVILQIGHLERFNQASKAVETLIHDPLFIESHRLSPFKPRSTDINVVLDLMIHDIDLILNIVNSPIKNIQSNGTPVLTNKIDIANARITFENGCVANVTASRVSMKSERKLRIFQPNNYLQVDFNQKKLNVYEKGDKEIFPGIPEIIAKEHIFEQRDALQEQIKHFIDCINHNQQPLVTGLDGKRALATALAINDKLNTPLQHEPA